MDDPILPRDARKPYRVLMVTGIYPTAARPDKGTYIKSQVESLIAAGLEVEVIHPKPGPAPLRYASAYLQVFLKTLTRKFDVVHGHYGIWCLTARLQWTTPVVASFLGSDLLGVVTADGGFSSFGERVARISRWLCRHVDAVIVKSEEMKNAVQGKGSIFIIPNGVDFDLFRPRPRAQVRAELGWDADRSYVLFGNDPRRTVKNFPLAQAAFERLHTRGVDAELVVANGLPHEQVAHYINASNAVLLTSFTEGSPNIVKEAMACNVPVVSTNVGDVAQLISDTDGCAVCPGDPDALADALVVALHHTEPTTGRSNIQHLDRSAVAPQVIAVYEQVIKK
ncbi:MAG TPA: glycosyltransferase, partial [Ktedonobacteraceae bacterium]|nr:glycosyltransferase [Ktedonobacteraceae bacterium]